MRESEGVQRKFHFQVTLRENTVPCIFESPVNRLRTGELRCFPRAPAGLFYSIQLAVVNVFLVKVRDTTFVNIFQSPLPRFEQWLMRSRRHLWERLRNLWI